MIHQGAKLWCPHCKELLATLKADLLEGQVISAELFEFPLKGRWQVGDIVFHCWSCQQALANNWADWANLFLPTWKQEYQEDFESL